MRTGRIIAAAAFCVCAFAADGYGQGAAPPSLERLHAALKLTTSQEDGWRKFQQAYTVNSADMTKRQDALASLSKLAAPQRVDLTVNLAKADLAGLEQRADALKSFYATLSAQQQSVFDRQTLLPEPNRN